MKNGGYLDVLSEAFSGSSHINSKDDALDAIQYPGENPHRFIAWNVILGILPANKNMRAQDALAKYNQYWSFVDTFFKDCKNWLEVESSDLKPMSLIKLEQEQLMTTIHTDVERTCSTLIKEYFPHTGKSREIERRVERILYNNAMYSPEMNYTQGFDRFAFIMFYLSKKYCDQKGLNDDFAESFAYFLSVSLLRLVLFHKFMGTEQAITDWMTKYQEVLYMIKPEIATFMDHLGIRPMQYTFRWFALLFADEHSPSEVIDIWDQCISHTNMLHKYVYCLSVAHISQIYEDCHEKPNFAESIHVYRDWNHDKLLKDSLKYFDIVQTPRKRSGCCNIGFLNTMFATEA